MNAMPKPCQLCGFPPQEKPPYHYPYCTPALRALVNVAEKLRLELYKRHGYNWTPLEEKFIRVVTRLRKERKS